jgi:hypothetical protein
MAASPSDDDRIRVRAALHHKLGVAAGVAVGTTAAKAAASVGASAHAAVAPAAAVVPAAAPGGAAIAGLGASTLAIVKVAAVAVAVAVAGFATLGPELGATSRTAVVSHDKGTGPQASVSAPRAVGVVAPPALAAGPPSAPDLAAPIEPALAAAADTSSPRDTVAVHTPASAPVASPAPSAPPTSVPNAAAPANDPTDELSMVKEMQVALRDGKTDRVLALVREHERRFPASALAPEREGARVLAVCSGGDRVDAQRLGQAFVDGHPLSPLAARVRATCGLVGER